MKHNQFKTQAFITLSNCGGIEIMLTNSEDGVYYRFNYGQDSIENEEIFESEIFYGYDEDETEITEDTESLPYFIHSYKDGSVSNYFLNQAIRTNL